MQTSTVPAPAAFAGRASFWAGLGLCVLGFGVAVLQYSLKLLVVPWYLPALTTLGAALLLHSVLQRASGIRVLALVLVTALAAFEWFFMGVLMRLTPYDGPARAGAPIPAFRTTLADGRPFSDADLRDGRPSVLVFFRGRW